MIDRLRVHTSPDHLYIFFNSLKGDHCPLIKLSRTRGEMKIDLIAVMFFFSCSCTSDRNALRRPR